MGSLATRQRVAQGQPVVPPEPNQACAKAKPQCTLEIAVLLSLDGLSLERSRIHRLTTALAPLGDEPLPFAAGGDPDRRRGGDRHHERAEEPQTTASPPGTNRPSQRTNRPKKESLPPSQARMPWNGRGTALPVNRLARGCAPPARARRPPRHGLAPGSERASLPWSEAPEAAAVPRGRPAGRRRLVTWRSRASAAGRVPPARRASGSAPSLGPGGSRRDPEVERERGRDGQPSHSVGVSPGRQPGGGGQNGGWSEPPGGAGADSATSWWVGQAGLPAGWWRPERWLVRARGREQTGAPRGRVEQTGPALRWVDTDLQCQ